jgi:hypothetical protein
MHLDPFLGVSSRSALSRVAVKATRPCGKFVLQNGYTTPVVEKYGSHRLHRGVISQTTLRVWDFGFCRRRGLSLASLPTREIALIQELSSLKFLLSTFKSFHGLSLSALSEFFGSIKAG